MSAHGSHAILVLLIPYEVPNRLSTTWIHVANKMPTTESGYRRPESISLREFKIACPKCKINVSGFKKYVRRKLDRPNYYSDIMYIHVLITKGLCNTSWNFAFHYKSDKVKKWKENLLISHHVSFWWSFKIVANWSCKVLWCQ